MAETKLWYREPASKWTEALPIGNGRLGGMVFGRYLEERIQLNEDSLYSDAPADRTNPDAARHVPQVRALVKAGRLREAERLAQASLSGIPRYLGAYQTLGDLFLRFDPHNEGRSEYVRELDLESGAARVRYRVGHCTYRRAYFASAADEVLVIRLEADRPASISFFANLMRRPFDPGSRILPGGRIVMKGRAGENGAVYCAMVQAVVEGAGLVDSIGDCIRVQGADAVTLLVAAQTTFRHRDPQAVCEEQLLNASSKSYDELYRAHVTDYRRLYTRVTVDLKGPNRQQSSTDERLRSWADGAQDRGLIELFFNYGRYLMISSSRPTSLPANLQGIWNESFSPPWESVFTININTEMNYWPAEVCALGECHLPLFDLIDAMRLQGRRTARAMYGCRGFVAHHNTSIWGNAAPTGAGVYIWPMGAAWLSLHFWDHYLYHRDMDFLRERAYPTLREAALFFVDFLIEDEDGTLITGLSQSPENAYRLPNGESGSIAAAPAMDSQIFHALFSAVIEASEILGEDESFRSEIERLRARLPQPKIGSRGQLLEWSEEYEEVEPGHRHMSHLFALSPGNQISPHRTPALAEAARKSLEIRLANGGGGTGWSRAWLVNFWARLGEGDRAHADLCCLVRDATYPNLMAAHPPFQIDGYFGATAGLAEMLLQSHVGELNILPALPRAWPDGHVTGLRARGGYTVNIAWGEGELVEAVVAARHDGQLAVRTPCAVAVTCRSAMVSHQSVAEHVIEFPVRAGRTYVLRPV